MQSLWLEQEASRIGQSARAGASQGRRCDEHQGEELGGVVPELPRPNPELGSREQGQRANHQGASDAVDAGQETTQETIWREVATVETAGWFAQKAFHAVIPVW